MAASSKKMAYQYQPAMKIINGGVRKMAASA
jgi:hypothetical protein